MITFQFNGDHGRRSEMMHSSAKWWFLKVTINQDVYKLCHSISENDKCEQFNSDHQTLSKRIRHKSYNYKYWIVPTFWYLFMQLWYIYFFRKRAKQSCFEHILSNIAATFASNNCELDANKSIFNLLQIDGSRRRLSLDINWYKLYVV